MPRFCHPTPLTKPAKPKPLASWHCHSVSWRKKVWQLLKISGATQQCTHMLRGLDHPSNFSIQGFVGLSTCKNRLTAVENCKNCKIRCSPGNTVQHFLYMAECTSPHILQEQDHGSHYNSHNHYHGCRGNNCKPCSMWLACSQFIGNSHTTLRFSDSIVYVIILLISQWMNEVMWRLLMMFLAVATTLSWHCVQNDKLRTMHLCHSVMRVS